MEALKGITVLLFGITVFFSSVPICLSQQIKYLAKVTINKARASLPHSFDLKIEGNCKTWNLELAPMKNIWSDVAQVVTLSKDENGETRVERENIPSNLVAYHDVNSESVLSVQANEIIGILDSNYSIIYEDGTQYVVELEKEKEYKEKLDDVLIADEIPPMDYVDGFNENATDSTVTDAANRMNGARDTNPIYTPEIVVIVDSQLSDMLGNNSRIYEYLTLFWNEIKVQYQYVKNPAINILLIGAVIIRDSYHEQYIMNNVDRYNRVSMLKVINELQRYVYEYYYYFPSHDIIYLITNRGYGYTDRSFGRGAVGGACKKDGRSRLSLSVAVGMDKNAVFLGTTTAAHEIGHLLGANHDDLSLNSCNPRDGYLMGESYGTRNSYFFSRCSLQSITANLAGYWASCLLSQFNETSPPGVFNSTQLPGDVISMKDQCRFYTGDATADIDVNTPEDKLCYNLQCTTRRGTANTLTRAAEGSLCPSGKRCSLGACV